MKINTKTRELFTDAGVFIKKLECKYKVKESDLVKTNNQLTIGNCGVCQKEIYKTQNLTDQEILQLVKKDPNICLHVDLKQSNINTTIQKLSYFHDFMGVSQIKCKDCNYVTDELTIYLKLNIKDPHQCQECGIISETNQVICNHTNSLSKTKPLFCVKCKSSNIEPIIKYIG